VLEAGSRFLNDDQCPPRSSWAWSGPPVAWCEENDVLLAVAPGGSDLFSMPGVREIASLPVLARAIPGDFRVWVSVAVEGESFADAAGLILRSGGGCSFKLCVECTPAGTWQIVSVASSPASDEAAGPAIDGPMADLLLTREGRRLAAFYRGSSIRDWRFLRTLHGWDPRDTSVGLFVQAPFSAGCSARFSALGSSAEPLADRR
jgi:regulation of enolase protein 1 (concanavalin A-like superfamily)